LVHQAGFFCCRHAGLPRRRSAERGLLILQKLPTGVHPVGCSEAN
jgi:hypothetical protein